MGSVANDFWVKLTNVNELIIVLLLVYTFGAFKNSKLFLQVATDSIKFDKVLLCLLVESKQNILNFFLRFIVAMFAMATSFMFF